MTLLQRSSQLFLISLLSCSRPAVPTDRQDVAESMVTISAKVNGVNSPSCTGFWIGYIDIVTARHCISKGANYNDVAQFSIHGYEGVYGAKVARFDDELIILRTYMPPPHEHTWLAPAKLKPRVGTLVTIMGHAYGVPEYSVFPGTVIRVEAGEDIDIDTNVPKGFSGAAVVSEEGLLGVITSGSAGDVRAIHIRALRKLVKTMPWITVPHHEACSRPGGDGAFAATEMHATCPPLQGDLGADDPYWPTIHPPEADSASE